MANELTKIPKFRRCVLQNFPFIEQDFDALTDYQLLSKVVEYLNKVITSQNEVIDEMESLTVAFNQLQSFVENYFENLDVQEEINNKLEQMAEAGTLQEIITQYIQANVAWCFDTVADMKASTNLVAGSYAQTLGFHTLNDGGGATYYISNTGTANEHDVIALSDSLLAVYVIEKGEVNIKQFGAKGDGTTDDTDAIQYAVNYAFEHNLTVKVNGTSNFYKVTMPIVINIERSSTGYWQGIGNKIIGANIADSRIVKIGDSVYTYHANPNVNNVNATFICANTNTSIEKGVGVYLDSLSLENYSDSTLTTKSENSYGLFTNVSRSTYKNLNISAYKGINANNFSCLYENIVFNCTEKAFVLDGGTSNTFRFMYAPGCIDPYTISSSYSTLMNVCCDGAKGTLFTLSGLGISVLNCGAESKNAQYIFKIANGFTTLKIDNFFMHRQIGDSDAGLALENCAVVYCDQQCFIDINDISVCEFDAIDTTQHNSTFFHVVGNATTMLTTNLKNLRYYKNFSGNANGRMKLWDSRPGAQCVQRYSTPPIEMSYVVTPNFEIYPFIGGYYGTDLTIDSQGNSINPANISASKTIWLDCKDQYHNENGTEIRYLTRHEKGDVQLFNDPLARNALGYAVTEKINNYTWNVTEIPIVLRGASTARPTANLYSGLCYFDTTLGKPIWYTGSGWVDATGTTV